jgi:hypothetical protein
MRNRAIAALTLATLALGTVAVPTVMAKPPDKVAVCHYDAVTDSYTLITVKASGAAAHLAHGDGLPGSGRFDPSCHVVVVPAVFIRAWTNADGVPGFQPGGTDVLIAELVDTHGGGGDGTLQPDAGDTLFTYRYPLGFGTTDFGTFGVTPHVVTTANDRYINDAAGNIFEFFTASEYEGYSERTPDATEGSTDVTFMVDYLGDWSGPGGGDALSIGAGSPGAPPTSVSRLEQVGSGNDAFIDVEFPLFGAP